MSVTTDRCDELFKMGLTFSPNHNAYIGKGDISDFNIHTMDIRFHDNDKWDKMLTKLKQEIRDRRL